MFHISIYVDGITLYSKFDHAFDLWQQLEFASEPESDIWDTVEWGRKWLVYLMLEKCKWFYLTGLIALVLLMWKWMSLLLKKNHLLRCWGWLSSKLDWALALSLLLKLPPRKLEPWFVLWRLLLFFYLYKSISVHKIYKSICFMSRLVPQVTTWNC